MKSINVEAGFCFCGGWNFSKSVIVDSTFIREMRVPVVLVDTSLLSIAPILTQALSLSRFYKSRKMP